MNTEWHLKQLRRRPIVEFDPTKSIPLWRVREDSAAIRLGDPATVATGWTKPTDPVFSLSERELDSLPEYVRAPSGTVKFGNVELNFGAQVLDRKDLATVFLIRDNLGKRPIYFSWSTASFPDQTLGLTPYLVSQGLVRKLYNGPVTPKPPVIMSAGLGWMDLDRTKALLWNAYRWQSTARPRPRGWVDNPSESILSLYGLIYAGSAETLRQQGDTALAARADSIANAVAASLRPVEKRAAPPPAEVRP